VAQPSHTVNFTLPPTLVGVPDLKQLEFSPLEVEGHQSNHCPWNNVQIFVTHSDKTINELLLTVLWAEICDNFTFPIFYEKKCVCVCVCVCVHVCECVVLFFVLLVLNRLSIFFIDKSMTITSIRYSTADLQVFNLKIKLMVQSIAQLFHCTRVPHHVKFEVLYPLTPKIT
jgi:hypothetical protein